MKGFARYWAYMIASWAIVFHSPVHSSEQCKDWAAKVQSLQGTVEIKTPSDQTWRNAELNQALCTGDSVRLAARSRAAIRLQNETILRLNENSQIVLSSVSKEKSSWVNLIKGIAHFISRTPKSLEIKTPFVNAAIDGTEFVVDVDSNKSTVTVFEGQVTVSNENGKLILTNNQSAEATKGSAPQSKIILKPRNSVQWALYYPPIIDYQSSFILKPEVKKIIDAFFVNDISSAFSQLEQLSETSNIADRLILRASLLLSVGQSKQAMQALNEALKKSPNMSSAFALKSIIALTQGDLSAAQQFADKSNLVNPTSVVAKLALSYIAQANFDLESARSLTREASMLSPSSPLVWARLSEMELSFEELGLALDAAKKAVTLAPDYVHTQVTLGFAHLYQFESQTALNVFTRAQKLAPYSPLANLGLGLSTIQIGDLDGGVKFLESAAIMDPNNSLLRSYLGKGYYEQNRFRLAETEFDNAKNLDTNDPTPFLYSALFYGAINESVLALENLSNSIQLNGNRAAFRSRQLLDRDLAARSASLSQIYSNLGFRQIALSESLKATIIDPIGFSSHRFLADVYAQQPRNEIASVSEYLQSQLFQPINTSPRLGASPVSRIPNLGQYELSMPISRSLFTRNGSHTNFSLLSSSNNTKFINSNVNGTNNRFSYNFNYHNFSTDGFQNNDDFVQDKVVFFSQYSVSQKLNVQFEFTDEKLKYGDVPYRINGFQRNTLRNNTTRKEKRIGIKYQLDSKRVILLSFISSRIEDFEKEFFLVPEYQSGSPGAGLERRNFTVTNGQSLELQYLFKSKRMTSIVGLGSLKYKIETEVDRPLVWGDLEFPQEGWPISVKNSPKNLDAYFYNYYTLPSKKGLLITGLSYNQYQSTNIDKNKFSPKLGIIWSPNKSTVFRAAAFQTFQRDKISNKTISPTHIAGFNQLYDDFNASTSTRYGASIDHKLYSKIFFGIKISKRDISQPRPIFNSNSEYSREELSAQSYIYWLLNSKVSVSTEIIRDRFDQENTSNDIDLTKARLIDTLSLPITLTLRPDNQRTVRIKATYIDQKAIFDGIKSEEKLYRDRFPTLDISVINKFSKHGLLSISMHNVLNEKMKYQSDFDAATKRISLYTPERTLTTQIRLNF